MADITAHSNCSPSPTLDTLERNSTPNPPELQPNSITLPDGVLHLQEEMNDAMVHLLTFRDSVHAHQQRLICGLEITHCQNETEALGAINGVEACYSVALHDTKAVYAAAMRETEADHLASTREAEATHATMVREAEAARAAQTSKLQQTHLENNVSSGRRSPKRGKGLSPILPAGLWGSSSGLSQQSPRDTHVPHTFTNR